MLDLFEDIRVGTYNVGGGVAEQKETPFDKRIPALLKLIEQAKLDILAIQELRRHPDTKMSPEEFCLRVSQAMGGSHYQMQRSNPSDLAFGKVIFWNPKRFFMHSTVTHYLSDCPTEVSDTWPPTKDESKPGFGFPVLQVNLNLVHEGKIVRSCNTGLVPVLEVLNVHFPPFNEATKLKCSNQVASLFDWRSDDVLIMGDFNSFSETRVPDENGIHKMQGGYQLRDQTESLYDIDGVKQSGTFLGFKSDSYKCHAVDAKGSSRAVQLGEEHHPMSHLDHIYTSDNIQGNGVSTLHSANKDLVHRNIPSDHILVSCPVSLKRLILSYW